MQAQLPIWRGVGGTPESFVQPHSPGPLVDLYREAGRKAGFAPEQLQVGLHSLGYVADTIEQAVADYYPGQPRTFTRAALGLDNPGEVAAKILRHAESLGRVSRVTFQMDNADLSPEKLLCAIERVKPLLG